MEPDRNRNNADQKVERLEKSPDKKRVVGTVYDVCIFFDRYYICLHIYSLDSSDLRKQKKEKKKKR